MGYLRFICKKLSGGRVYSFEPTPSTLEVLNKTIRLNKVQSFVEVIPAAVADENKKATFFIDRVPGAVANSLIQYGNRRAYTVEYEVDVVALDDFVQKKDIRVDFIKIDAEGVEFAILKGASYILSNHRPIIILGIHPMALEARQETNEMIWNYLENKKYRVVLEDRVITKEEFCIRKELFDVHLLPQELNS